MNTQVYITLPTGLFCLPMPNMQILSFIITQFLMKNIKVGIKRTLKVFLGKKSSGTWLKHACVLSFKKLILTQCTVLNSVLTPTKYISSSIMHICIACISHPPFIGGGKSSHTVTCGGVASYVDLRDIRAAASVVGTVGRWRKALQCGRNMVRVWCG